MRKIALALLAICASAHAQATPAANPRP